MIDHIARPTEVVLVSSAYPNIISTRYMPRCESAVSAGLSLQGRAIGSRNVLGEGRYSGINRGFISRTDTAR